MKRLGRLFLPLCAVFLLIATIAGAGTAITNRYIRVTNTSTSPGISSITIESFGLLVAKGPESSGVQGFTANVSIPAASTPANSAILIRNGLTAVLPLDYTVTVPPGAPNFVQIARTSGTFTIGIVSSVGTQIYTEDNVTLPGTNARSLAGLAVALLAMALVALGMRKRREA